MSNLYLSSIRSRFLYLLILTVVLFIPDKILAMDASKEDASDTTSRRRNSTHPHCGLYCVYSLLELVDKDVDFRELIKPEYIGSSKGSSMNELKKAAEHYGLYVAAADKLSSRELRSSPYPIILHVKSSLESQEYDHYELFLGIDNGKARLFSPPNPVRSVPYSEIGPRWDGNGLIVSAEPIDIDLVFGPGRRRLLLYVAVTIAGIFSVHVAKKWLPKDILYSYRKQLRISLVQCAAFAVVTLLCGLLYHFDVDGGLLTNSNAISAIQENNRGSFIPKIGERKVHKLLDDDTVFIDARFTRDYKAGHIEGAISVPVDANDVERQKATAEISKDADIVLYCQSSLCKYAEIVAIKLIEDGFSNICIFRGGWTEWVAKNGRPRDVTL